jgi:hypothetical protein
MNDWKEVGIDNIQLIPLVTIPQITYSNPLFDKTSQNALYSEHQLLFDALHQTKQIQKINTPTNQHIN